MLGDCKNRVTLIFVFTYKLTTNVNLTANFYLSNLYLRLLFLSMKYVEKYVF